MSRAMRILDALLGGTVVVALLTVGAIQTVGFVRAWPSPVIVTAPPPPPPPPPTSSRTFCTNHSGVIYYTQRDTTLTLLPVGK